MSVPVADASGEDPPGFARNRPTPGLSKSLLRLAEAGLVVPRREGYYVVYTLAPDRLEALAEAFRRFLGGP